MGNFFPLGIFFCNAISNIFYERFESFSYLCYVLKSMEFFFFVPTLTIEHIVSAIFLLGYLLFILTSIFKVVYSVWIFGFIKKVPLTCIKGCK